MMLKTNSNTDKVLIKTDGESLVIDWLKMVMTKHLGLKQLLSMFVRYILWHLTKNVIKETVKLKMK